MQNAAPVPSSLISGFCMVSVDSLCLLCAVIYGDVLSGNMLTLRTVIRGKNLMIGVEKKDAESIDTPTCVYSAVRLSGLDTLYIVQTVLQHYTRGHRRSTSTRFTVCSDPSMLHPH